MISYAQNFEDVILRRVFHNKAAGFYIDVGAMDPVADSVTKFFYDQGWCGINIEPNESFFHKLVSERERDINLNIALGDREEVKTFFAAYDTGLSTLDEQNRNRLVERGFQSEEKTIRVSTLAAICEEHVNRTIDFLKIDCEGWEKQTLAGADWSRFQPTVVVVEATLPGSRTPAWSEWEPILLQEGRYEMVYFDGLNRFYLRHDSPGLRTHFDLPPNVYDGFKTHATEIAEQAAWAMTRERDSLLESLKQRVTELEQERSERALENQQLAELQCAAEAAAQANQMALEAREGRIEELERERRELNQALLKTRLWVGRLSQDLAAARARRHS